MKAAAVLLTALILAACGAATTGDSPAAQYTKAYDSYQRQVTAAFEAMGGKSYDQATPLEIRTTYQGLGNAHLGFVGGIDKISFPEKAKADAAALREVTLRASLEELAFDPTEDTALTDLKVILADADLWQTAEAKLRADLKP